MRNKRKQMNFRFVDCLHAGVWQSLQMSPREVKGLVKPKEAHLADRRDAKDLRPPDPMFSFPCRFGGKLPPLYGWRLSSGKSWIRHCWRIQTSSITRHPPTWRPKLVKNPRSHILCWGGGSSWISILSPKLLKTPSPIIGGGD